MRLQGSGWYGHDTGTVMPIPGVMAPVGMDTAYQQPNNMNNNEQQWRDAQEAGASRDRRRQQSLNASSQVN